MKHTTTADDRTERAAAYALGTLTQHEARSFEEHLQEGCDACSIELQEFESVVAHLAWSAPLIAPPPSAREKLLARILEEASPQPAAKDEEVEPSQTAEASSLLIVRADEGEWIETADAGVFVKLLFVDKERDTVTTLVRMQPGARMPPHRHLGVEQCLVLEGDVESQGHRLRAGDYNCAMSGSIHQDLTTEHGALLLIVAPESYELMQTDSGR